MELIQAILYIVFVGLVVILTFYVYHLDRRLDERIYLVEKELECIEKWYLGIDDQSEDDQNADDQSEEVSGDG